MRKKKTLLIIDMQAEFSDPPCKDKITPVCSLIRLAKKNNWNIINLLYDVEELCQMRWDDDDDAKSDDTKAFPRIEAALKGYKNCARILKSDCDGGREVVDHLHLNNIKQQDIIVCGCYADQCVQETIERIRHLLPKVSITIVRKAVKPCYKFPAEDYNRMKVNVHTGTYISLTL